MRATGILFLVLTGAFATGSAIGCVGMGCSPQPIMPAPSSISSSSPIDTSSCWLANTLPARMFALDAPATATANATFSITAWVFVNQGSWGHLPDRPNPTSFTASIDPASRTITVTGTITRTDRNPNALGPCVVNFMAVQPLPASVSLPVAVASGSYTLVIPPTAFSSQVALPGIATVSYPLPLATRSILIQ